jgi:hypothetical protein
MVTTCWLAWKYNGHCVFQKAGVVTPWPQHMTIRFRAVSAWAVWVALGFVHDSLILCVILGMYAGGRVSSKEAKLLSTDPKHRAMPISFRTGLMMLKYWQAQLLEASLKIE